ncbi:hypothetical protein [Burkholderia sp. Ac-20365]|uniref:hypothetical protein n=1 Tax=Burkholderia sp. Ac-20365 TaxID=2703897 RepID=UPI00197B0CA5|nr:hypothetical protein [Burkholderia sp. Ac-20365]
MASTRDKVIEGTAQAEAILREFGASGRGFGEMVRDLSDRNLMPKGLARRAMSANRVRNRVVHEAATPDDIELDQWASGVTALTDWLNKQRRASAEPPSPEHTARAKVSPHPREGAGRLRVFARVQPWMVISACVITVGSIGSAWHYGTTLIGNPTQSTQQTANPFESRADDHDAEPPAPAVKRNRRHSHPAQGA